MVQCQKVGSEDKRRTTHRPQVIVAGEGRTDKAFHFMTEGLDDTYDNGPEEIYTYDGFC